jgi:hypothetical protein
MYMDACLGKVSAIKHACKESQLHLNLYAVCVAATVPAGIRNYIIGDWRHEEYASTTVLQYSMSTSTYPVEYSRSTRCDQGCVLVRENPGSVK